MHRYMYTYDVPVHGDPVVQPCPSIRAVAHQQQCVVQYGAAVAVVQDAVRVVQEGRVHTTYTLSSVG